MSEEYICALLGEIKMDHEVQKIVKKLLKNINTQPLKFPAKVSKDVENLLVGMLGVKEINRFSWEEILKHPLFGG